MGLLQNGKWVDKWYDTKSTQGKFVRDNAQFRHWITADGSAGPTGDAGFKAESGRYHLYVSLACPWAHRTLIFRTLKSLQAHISVTVVEPHMLENGWEFYQPDGHHFSGHHISGAEQDSLNGKQYLYQIYQQADPHANCRVTVPLLWDKKTKRIVSNESADIIRMFNSAFNQITGNQLDLYPQALRSQIDEVNQWVYESINNGVYKTGFATTQTAYEEAFDALFAGLEKAEHILGKQRYLVADTITEADWRLFTTLIRFDAVYVGHFKTNLKTIEDHPNLANYLRALYQMEGIAETVNLEHIKQHYYFSHATINPSRIVPKGPALDFWRPHNRG